MFASPNLSTTSLSSGDKDQIYHSQHSSDNVAISWSALESTTSPPSVHYGSPDSASVPSVSLFPALDFTSSDDEWSNTRQSSSPVIAFDHFSPPQTSPLLGMGAFSYGSASPASHLSSGSTILPYVSSASSPFLSEQQSTWLAPDAQYEPEDIVSQGIQEIKQGIPPPYSQHHITSPTVMTPPAYDGSTIFSLHTNHHHSSGSQDDFTREMENLTIDNITKLEFCEVFDFDENFMNQNDVKHALKAPVSPHITVALPANTASMSHEFDDNLSVVGDISSTRRRRSQSDLPLVPHTSTSAIPNIGSHQRQYSHGPSNSVDSGLAVAPTNNGGSASTLSNFLHPNDARNLRRGRSLNAVMGSSNSSGYHGVGPIRSAPGWPIQISGHYYPHRRGSISRSSSPYTRPSSVASTNSNVSSYYTTNSSSPSSSPRSISSFVAPRSPPSSAVLASVVATVTSMPKQENMVEVPESERRYKSIVAHPRVNDANHRRRTTEAKFKCDICGDDFTRKFRLQTHMNSHLNQHRYRCRSEGCTSMFNNLDDCVRHESQQHNVHRFRRESGCV